MDESKLIAIDVLLQPDQRMEAEAQRWNARMREQAPDGFELDEAHAPHVTLVQRFVAESDLPSVLAAVEEVRRSLDLSSLEMEATALYHIPSGEIGLAGIVIEPSGSLLAIHEAVIEAVGPFVRSGGDESAFVPDPSGTPFDPYLFEYVEGFVPGQSGANYNPHVSIGVAPLGWLEEVEAQPFEAFTFGAVGIATYHLGNFGTAAARLDPTR